MKQIAIFLFLLSSSSAFAQELQPTATEVLLNISTTDLKNKPIEMDFITIKGKTNGKSFYFKSHFKSLGSKFSFLIPKNETYLVMFSEFGSQGSLSCTDIALNYYVFVIHLQLKLLYEHHGCHDTG